MSELACLVGHRFQSLTRREFDWVLAFDQHERLVIACLWRLVEDGRIRFTSQDDGRQFGLPAPVDARNEVNRRLAGASVRAEDVLLNPENDTLVSRTSGRPITFGWTSTGRHIAVIWETVCDGPRMIRVRTAYDVEPKRRKP
jgi:hypothetical protein